MNGLAFRTAWPLYTGMTVAGTAAVVASASTLAGLARAAGWAGWTPWLLPAAVDIGGSAGGWCWLRAGFPGSARQFGRLVALTGAAATLLGNATGHLLAAGYLQPTPALVVVVGAVPAAVLIALAHLAALLTADPTDAPPIEPPHESAVDTRAAVRELLGDGPLTVAALARTTGRSRTTIEGHLAALIRRGHVTRGKDKRYQLVGQASDEQASDTETTTSSEEGTG